jgi:hypothetical protein
MSFLSAVQDSFHHALLDHFSYRATRAIWWDEFFSYENIRSAG